MLLSLSKISKVYGMQHILKNISLEIPPKTITLLTGHNGSGKSTLLKIMAGIITPTKGSVNSKCKPGTIGYLGHSTFIYPQLSALENLKFWGKIHQLAVSKKTLENTLDRMGLLHVADEYAGCFSYGMSQRLNFSRVLLLKPQLLLLDEPCTGIDVHSLKMIHNEIIQAKNWGAGIVWITHAITHDLHKGDYIVVLNNKSIEYYGPTTDYNHIKTNKNISPC